MDEYQPLDILNGHPLRVERCRHNLTQEELADRALVSTTTIWRAEKDYPISAASRQRLCAYFSLTSEELGLHGKEKRKLATVAPQEALVLPVDIAPFLPTKLKTNFDVLFEGADEATSEQLTGAWLALESCNIASLFDAGWTLDDILDSLRVILQSVKGLSMTTRRKVLQLGGTTLTSNVLALKEKHASVEEQVQFHNSLARSIADGWNSFHAGKTSHVLVTGQALLALAQYYYSSFYSTTTPILYSPTYLLITAGHYFQGHFSNALNSAKKAYILALEACDTRNMAESLSWQGGIWKACGQQMQAIQATEAAVRLVKDDNDTLSRVTQARLYAHWAESAALLQQPRTVQKMLDASAALLDSIEPNLEFDNSTWHYYQGTCAFYLGDMVKADEYFQQAIQKYPQNSIQHHTTTMLFQAKTRLEMRDKDGALSTTRLALPLVATINAPLISWGFVDHLQEMKAKFPDNSEVMELIHETQQVLALPRHRTIPRYLEGTLE